MAIKSFERVLNPGEISPYEITWDAKWLGAGETFKDQPTIEVVGNASALTISDPQMSGLATKCRITAGASTTVGDYVISFTVETTENNRYIEYRKLKVKKPDAG